MTWSQAGFAVILSATITAATIPLEAAMPELITSVEGITEFRLGNGTKVLLFPDSTKPTVTVNMTVFVGSRHEGYGEAGMAHLLEHMLFKGTPDHPNIPKALQDRGARFNGTTWLDRTNYFETLPASDDNLEFALHLESDRLMNSYVKNEDLQSEFTVVRSEFERGENSPQRVLFQRMMSAAFDWHNYGRSTIGNRADIERVPIENLRAFYRKYYQPDNIMVVVAGKFDPRKGLALVEKYFGSIPRPERELPQTYTVEPAGDGERLVTLRRVGDVPVVGTLYHIPSGPHPDFVAVDVMEGILTAAPSGRLYKALVETRKAARVSGGAFALHDPGMLRFVAEVNSEIAPEVVLETLVDVVEGFADTEITQEEVDRARDRLLRVREQGASNSSQIAVELSEWAAQGDWRLYFLYRDRLEKVTIADVKRVAKAYMQRNNRTAGVYFPTEEAQRISVPATPSLAEMIGDYKGREDVALGEAFEVTPENIQNRTITRKLSTGLQVAMLPKKTRGSTVKLELTLRYGDESSLKSQAKAAEFLPALMLRGTGNFNRQEIQDQLNRARIQLRGSGGPGTATFVIQATREQLQPSLDLLAEVLRNPSFPAEEFETMKQAQITGLEARLTDPTALASNTVNRQLSPYRKSDPRYIATPAEEVEMVQAVTLDQIIKLYREQLGASVGELSLVGDFDPDEVVSSFERMLSDWKSPGSFERLGRDGDVKYKPADEMINTPDKANATYFAGTVFPMKDDHPDNPALTIGNFILGGGSLSSRLGNRVRQQEGLSYSVGSGLRSSSLDARTTFYIFAIANPSNVPKLKVVIREELDKLLKGGITEQELAAAKQGYLQGQEVSRADDGRLVGMLSQNLFIGRTMEFTADREAAIRNLTVADVNAALKKYIKPDSLLVVTAGDLAGVDFGGKSDE